MSGFAAAVGPPGSPEPRRWVEQATGFMAFRGPDGSDVVLSERAALGCALLATAPEDAGRPPVSSLADGLWLTGDVRLDARSDLIRELRARGGNIPPAASDAQLILHAYATWGEACLERLAGDFAFAIWDQRSTRLFCGRDQFGVGQFFYAQVGERLLVSNTLDCLLLHPDVSDQLDEQVVGDLLTFTMNLALDRSIFSQVRRLPPAHSLSWSEGRIEVKRYWRVPEPSGFLRYSKADDYVDRFRALLTESVRDRLPAAAVSVQLSGGMDSTSVAAVARGLRAGAGVPFALKGICIDLSGLMPDEESRYARGVAEYLGIELEILRADSYDLLDPFEPGSSRTPEPGPYAPTGVHRDLVLGAAAAARVAFTGLGGDPLLMFIPSYWITWLQQGRFGRLAAATWHHLRLFHRPPSLYLQAALRHARRPRLAALAPPDWLEPSFVSRSRLEARIAEVIPSLPTEANSRDLAESPAWPMYLGWADPGFTGVPLQFRHPFFNVRLLEFVRGLPPEPWFPRKQLLRDAMKGLLPVEVRERRKTTLSKDPTLAVRQRDGLSQGAIRLATEGQGLEQFVQRGRLAERLRSGSEGERRTHKCLTSTLAFAQWLHHRRRPRAPEHPRYSGTQPQREWSHAG